jgi:hypothetical protein
MASAATKFLEILQRAQKTVQCSIFKDLQHSVGVSLKFSVARLCDSEARRRTHEGSIRAGRVFRVKTDCCLGGVRGTKQTAIFTSKGSIQLVVPSQMVLNYHVLKAGS